MNDTFNLVGLVRVWLKWKKWIIGATLVAGLASVAISLWVLDEYYESSAVFYPINQGITDRSMLFSSGGEVRVDYYGTKYDVNRILDLANSSPIIDFLINYYNLAEHYDVDTTKIDWRSKVKKKFESNYEAIKTEREAVSITLFDTDPQLAADMVNMILQKVDEQNKAPVIKNKLRITETFRKKVGEKQVELDSATVQLGVLADKHQISVKINSDGTSTISGPNTIGVELYKIAQQKHQALLDELTELTTIYEQYEVSSSENVPSIHVLEKAYPADRRSKPVRSLFCITVTMVTFFMSLIGVLLIEQVQYIRRELKNDPATA